MSSPAAVIPQTPRRRGWYQRPEGTPRTHAVPRYSWLVQDAHDANEHRIYEFLQRHSEPLVINGQKAGSLAKNLSEGLIARELNLHRSTVERKIARLIAKHSIRQYDAQSGNTIRRKPGDRLGTTSWFLPIYHDVLRDRRADPTVFNDRRGNCWVIGKGKRFLTPAEAELWGMTADSATAAPSQARALYCAVMPGPTEQREAARADAPAAGTKPPLTGAPETGPPASESPQAVEDVDVIPKAVWQALKLHTHNGPTRQVAQQIVGRALAIAAQRGEDLSWDELAGVIAHASRQAKGGRAQKCVYYVNVLGEQLGKFFDWRRAQEEAARATAVTAGGASILDDPVVKTDVCRKCGGTVERFQSGAMSWCRCGPAAMIGSGK